MCVAGIVARQVRSLRLDRGLSQRDLASRIPVPRTYVSKIENEKATPTLSSLGRLARALEVTVSELLSPVERNRQREIGEFLADPFISTLVPFVSRLSAMQRDDVMKAARDLPRRHRLAS